MAGVKGQVQRRGVQRRRTIVDAAMRLFAENGFRGTGLAAIAQLADTTPSGIIHHFGSKEGLLEAVISERDARVSARLMSVASAGGLAALRGMVLIAEEVEREPSLAALYTVLEVENLSPDAPAHEFFVRRSGAVCRLVEDLLAVGLERGEFRTGWDVTRKAAEILAFMEGAQLLWLLDPDRHSLVGLYMSYFAGVAADLQAGDGAAR